MAVTSWSETFSSLYEDFNQIVFSSTTSQIIPASTRYNTSHSILVNSSALYIIPPTIKLSPQHWTRLWGKRLLLEYFFILLGALKHTYLRRRKLFKSCIFPDTSTRGDRTVQKVRVDRQVGNSVGDCEVCLPFL